MNFIKLEKKDRYAIVTIDRVDKLNALNNEVLDELGQTIEEINNDAKMRATVITGAGERIFVSGADIAAMQVMQPAQLTEFTNKGRKILAQLADADFISVAAINGAALGGGLELALACDLRFAVNNAKLGLPEVGLGLVPAFGGTQFLPRVIGKGLALELILCGNIISSERGYEIGLINRLYPIENFLQEVEKFIQKKLLAKNSMMAQTIARQSVHQGLSVDLKKGLSIEKELVVSLAESLDYREGLSAFLEKRKPDFSTKA